MLVSSLISVFIFIVGACVGSFLSVVIHRIRTNSPGIIAGKSQCPYCKKSLRRRDMIPILSYLWLRGQCFFCHRHIPATYPLLELMTGLVLLALYWKFMFIWGESIDVAAVDYRLLLYFIWYALIGILGVAIFWYDLQTQQIPTLFLWGLLVIAFIGRLALFPLEGVELFLAVIVALVFFGGQHVLSKGKWLGSGDVYLGLSMALVLSWPLILLAISLSYIVGTLLCLPLLFSRKVKKGMSIAFGPFLIIGLFLTIFFGEQLVGFYQAYFWF